MSYTTNYMNKSFIDAINKIGLWTDQVNIIGEMSTEVANSKDLSPKNLAKVDSIIRDTKRTCMQLDTELETSVNELRVKFQKDLDDLISLYVNGVDHVVREHDDKVLRVIDNYIHSLNDVIGGKDGV